MNLVYFYNEEWEKEFVSPRLSGMTIAFFHGAIHDHDGERFPDADAISVFGNSKLGAVEFDRFPNLRFIATRTTGFDHVDLAEATRRGILVANVPAYGERTVAEYTMALLLSLSRKINDAANRVEQDGSFAQDGLRGFDLFGKTLGVVGTGHIGRYVIAFAKTFGMNILAYDVREDSAYATAQGFRYVPLAELLQNSDIISLHAPLFDATRHMINMENIALCKKGSYLINTARGGLVETSALVKGLETGIFAGAALDVLEEEGELAREELLLSEKHPSAEYLKTILANHYLMRHPRVLVTAHIAFNTQEAFERILETTTENLRAFESGNPTNLVSPRAD